MVRVIHAISSAGTRATFTPRTGTAKAWTTEVPAAQRSGQGQVSSLGTPFPCPEPREEAAGGRKPFPRARGPAVILLEGQQRHNRKSRCLGWAAGREPESRTVPSRGCSWPPSPLFRLGSSRGARATAALHGRGTGAGEQPVAPGWKMQGRSPQLSMELNSECVVDRGDGSEQEGAAHWQQAPCPHSQSTPRTGSPRRAPRVGSKTPGWLWFGWVQPPLVHGGS